MRVYDWRVNALPQWVHETPKMSIERYDWVWCDCPQNHILYVTVFVIQTSILELLFCLSVLKIDALITYTVRKATLGSHVAHLAITHERRNLLDRPRANARLFNSTNCTRAKLTLITAGICTNRINQTWCHALPIQVAVLAFLWIVCVAQQMVEKIHFWSAFTTHESHPIRCQGCEWNKIPHIYRKCAQEVDTPKRGISVSTRIII